MLTAITHKTDALRRLQYLVTHGYTHWISGTVSPKQIEALTLKFSDRYRVDATDMQRYRAKKKGEANCQLVIFQGETALHWWLLATPGEGLVYQLETLKDANAKGQRITWPENDYELVKEPRKAAKASWTWRMTAECFEAWQERLKNAVRRVHSDDALTQALWSLKRVPGFRESRRQAFSLVAYAKAEWARSRKGEWPHGEIFIGWQGRYKKPTTTPIDTIVAKAKRKKALSPPPPPA